MSPKSGRGVRIRTAQLLSFHARACTHTQTQAVPRRIPPSVTQKEMKPGGSSRRQVNPPGLQPLSARTFFSIFFSPSPNGDQAQRWHNRKVKSRRRFNSQSFHSGVKSGRHLTNEPCDPTLLWHIKSLPSTQGHAPTQPCPLPCLGGTPQRRPRPAPV